MRSGRTAMSDDDGDRIKREYLIFEANQRNIQPEYLEPFRGKQVAWSFDGTRIVASGDTDEDVSAELARLGIDPERVVFSYVPREDDIFP
jgi:hypothetical protein